MILRLIKQIISIMDSINEFSLFEENKNITDQQIWDEKDSEINLSQDQIPLLLIHLSFIYVRLPYQ